MRRRYLVLSLLACTVPPAVLAGGNRHKFTTFDVPAAPYTTGIVWLAPAIESSPFRCSVRRRLMMLRRSFLGLALFVSALAGVSPALAGGPRPFHSEVTARWDNVLAALPPSFGGAGVAHFDLNARTFEA